MNFSKMLFKSIGLALVFVMGATLGSEAQNVQIKPIPEVVEVEVGETFTVDIALNQMENPVSVVDMFLNFDPEYLQVQSITILQEEDYNFHIPPSFNNENGRIKMSAFKLDGNVSEGDVGFVEIEFLALVETDLTEVSHNQNIFPTTTLAFAGEKVQADTNPLLVSINSADPLSDGLLSEDEYSLDLWPNPASNYAIVTLKLPIDERVRISLYDNTGRLLKSVFEGMMYSSTTNHFDLDLQHLADGVYAVEFLLGDQIHTEKLIISK